MYPYILITAVLLILIMTCISFELTPAASELTIQFEQGPKIHNDSNLKVEVVSTGEIKFPSSMAFLAPNDILVLEKNEGTVKRIKDGNVLSEPLLDVNVGNKNERGMLGIAVDNQQSFDKSEKEQTNNKTSGSAYVFLYYTQSEDKDGSDAAEGKEPLGNRLYRYELANNKLVNPKLLLDLPTTPSAIHNGGKIAIGSDNTIYLVVGNINARNSKMENIPNGKNPDGTAGILHVTTNGKAIDNILGKKGYLGKYYAYGIRNSFGLGLDPVTGSLWDTENGPNYGDEINLVKPGFNSGFNKIQGMGNPNQEKTNEAIKLVNFKGRGNYSSPEFVWNHSVGVTDILFFNSDKLGKHYENDMFVGDFHKGHIYHFDLSKDRESLDLKGPLNDKTADYPKEFEKVIFGEGFGGITDLQVGLDGYLYVLGTNFGGDNCSPSHPDNPCVPYNSTNIGTIFRILPR